MKRHAALPHCDDFQRIREIVAWLVKQHESKPPSEDDPKDHPGQQFLDLFGTHRWRVARPQRRALDGGNRDPPPDQDARDIGQGIPAQREFHPEDRDRKQLWRDIRKRQTRGHARRCSSLCGEVNLVPRGCAAHIEVKQTPEADMQTRNKVFEDISQLMTNAMGVAQGAKEEAETAMKSMIDRWLADRDFVTREEFDAVRAMAMKAREENEMLKARLDALEAAKK